MKTLHTLFMFSILLTSIGCSSADTNHIVNANTAPIAQQQTAETESLDEDDTPEKTEIAVPELDAQWESSALQMRYPSAVVSLNTASVNDYALEQPVQPAGVFDAGVGNVILYVDTQPNTFADLDNWFIANEQYDDADAIEGQYPNGTLSVKELGPRIVHTISGTERVVNNGTSSRREFILKPDIEYNELVYIVTIVTTNDDIDLSTLSSRSGDTSIEQTLQTYDAMINSIMINENVSDSL